MKFSGYWVSVTTDTQRFYGYTPYIIPRFMTIYQPKPDSDYHSHDAIYDINVWLSVYILNSYKINTIEILSEREVIGHIKRLLENN